MNKIVRYLGVIKDKRFTGKYVESAWLDIKEALGIQGCDFLTAKAVRKDPNPGDGRTQPKVLRITIEEVEE